MTRVLAFVGLVSLALACRPIGPIPGGRLSGEIVTDPVADWSFASEAETLQLETRPDDPYSVNVWFVAQGSSLWVAAGGGEKSRWVQNAGGDSRVRLRIDGKIYERMAVRVSEQTDLDAIVALYGTKYQYERDPEDEARAVVFRMDAR